MPLGKTKKKEKKTTQYYKAVFLKQKQRNIFFYVNDLSIIDNVKYTKTYGLIIDSSLRAISWP